MRTYLEAKAMAKSLRAALAAKGIALSHSECLELVSKQIGFDEWNMLSAKIALGNGEREPRAPSGIMLEPAIPVVSITSALAAKRFYIDFLSFAVDWGWPENHGERPLYAQISRSGATLHLSSHHVDRGATELFIRMAELDSLYAELSTNADQFPLNVRRTPDDRREILVTDPFGNRLRFSENNPPGISNE